MNMNRIREVFGVDRVVLPVIHPIGLAEALASVEVAHAAGAKGVFTINQGMNDAEVLALVREIWRRYPALWVGVNLLGHSPSAALGDALDACGRIDGIWSDNALVDERATDQPAASELLAARRARGWTGLYFGGVAFKYQREVAGDALGRAAVLATSYMDVVCTSGPGTGKAADVAKVIAMRQAIGPEGAIALASGITAENVTAYLPYVDAFLVGTGIEARLGVLDPGKLAALLAVLQG
jgi:predicted TIM-barrel enzyme